MFADRRMWQELQSIVERVSSDATVRAIVLASAWSKGFTAGLDRQSVPYSAD